MLLAVVPVVVLHSAVVIGLAALTSIPRWVNVALLPLDVALLVVLFRWLRRRFDQARRERVATERR
jgi:membrane protein implicated in regulation of membrane protease activity